MISPTVGRKVWYSPSVDLGEARNRLSDEQYFDATVIFAHSDRVVNLRVVDHRGHEFTKEYAPLLQEGDAPNPRGGHCLWMPYQNAQAGIRPMPTLQPIAPPSREEFAARLIIDPPSTGRES